jgi:P-type Cu+ transporter
VESLRTPDWVDNVTTLELPVQGMDCAGCTKKVQKNLAALSGVRSAEVLLSSEKAVVEFDPERATLADLRRAVEDAGYRVPVEEAAPASTAGSELSRSVLRIFGVVFAAVLAIVVVGEWLGLFEAVTSRVPWPVWAAFIAAFGWPVFRSVARVTRKGQVISHTLMTVGLLAAALVGEWAAALVVVFFMRVGDYTEKVTTERARRAVKDLVALAPQTARVERGRAEVEVPIAEVRVGDTVVVRPGEKVPVDGEVLSGQATVNQATITGESMPVEVEAGGKVFAATLAQLGSLRVKTTGVGRDTTFGRVIKLVEEAETHRAEVQSLADKVSAYYLPVVAVIAVLTYVLSRDALATAAVLLVACSCSFALATPIAMLASVGAAAKRGLLIKGGKYLEALARADVLLVDKTGTLTLGKPQVTDVVSLGAMTEDELLRLAASAERDSEHPLAESVRLAAHERGLRLSAPERFEALPGRGVRAVVEGMNVAVGSARLVPAAAEHPRVKDLEAQGKTLLLVARNGIPVGVLAAADTPRPEVPKALEEVKRLGIKEIELLTGDNARTAAALAAGLGIGYRANLLPEDKIAVVRAYQAEGHTVVMVGDGVNDAPALAQADVGIAMGAAGTDVALEVAHIALMREDWELVPKVLGIAKRTMRTVKGNLGFTVAYNLVGLSLAAFGFLPPVLAAALQSIPDLGILANSSRLLRQK